MPLIATVNPPNTTEIAKTTYHNLTPIISATRVARILWFGRLLKSDIPNHNNKMAKNGCQKEILAVFPIKPQVANDIMITTHQGNII